MRQATASPQEADHWRLIAERNGTPFLTWEWASAWWSHLGTGHEPFTEAVRDERGRIVAILPLCLGREGPLRVLRFVGYGPADQLGPICSPANRERAALALRCALQEGPRSWDVFVGDYLPAREGWAAALEARVEGRESSPLIELGDGGFEAYLRHKSRNFREQVRRRERKLVRDRGLRFRLTQDASKLRGDLDALIALHEARWGRGSQAFAGPRRAFHHDLAARALVRGWLRLWTAELDGRPAAAWYGFRYGGDEWFYQSGRDPSLDDTSVGFVLLAHTVREAANDGMRRYRLLLGDEAYKARWATGEEPVETVRLGRGPLGRTAMGLTRARAVAGTVVRGIRSDRRDPAR